ncbi:DNA/RNA polymerase [Xylariomycetidae sp. FL0641]|nr:DNA/RNA polymerase [Xylariomycetidae sp. FL0641]
MRNTLSSSAARTAKPPKRSDSRVILHFDYDCFYASVFENENPGLKSLPLGIKQKSILATCNYVARARGVKKLMLISDAQKICPDLVLMNGEDLTRFRDASRKLWSILRAHSWNNRVERLGLDEVFLDVTDIIAYNQEMMNIHSLSASFFHLDRQKPEKGFAFDGTRFLGHTYPPADATHSIDTIAINPLCTPLLLASHLAGYLRHKLDDEYGYTSSGGISTNKVLAKLAGSVNKPNAQTTLLSFLPCAHDTHGTDVVQAFMDAHKLREVPGIGWRTTQLIKGHVQSTNTGPEQPSADPGDATALTVRDVRLHPGLAAETLERILARPGAERGSGARVWALLHGVDASEVKVGSTIPTQLSVENTYMARPLQTQTELSRELRTLAASLMRRLRVELREEDAGDDSGEQDGDGQESRWIAYPKTLRLSTRVRTRGATASHSSSTSVTNTINNATSTEPTSWTRHTRSQPLPPYALSAAPLDVLAERLTTEVLLPLFRRLHSERCGWNLALLNLCATNMVVVAGVDNTPAVGGVGTSAGGRDIGRMFRTQENKLREWTVYDTSPVPVLTSTATRAFISTPAHTQGPGRHTPKGFGNGTSAEDHLCLNFSDTEMPTTPDTQTLNTQVVEVSDVSTGSEADPVTVGAKLPHFLSASEDWDDEEEVEEFTQRCLLCGHRIPGFATAAHERFHALGD